MASIKGFQIKGLVKFEGRDWQGAQGNIYLDGKKVGWYNDAGNGGMADIDFYQAGDGRKECEEKLKHAMKEYFHEHPLTGDFADLEPDGELFFAELLQLIDDEKQYKKMQKQGCSTVLIYKESENSPYERITGLPAMDDTTIRDKAVEKYIQINEITEFRIYKSPSDFDIE